MSLEKREQYEYEINSWRRTLDYLQQENIHMKNRLAAIVQADVGNDLLEKAENYQNILLNKDTIIRFLRSDIYKLQTGNFQGIELALRKQTVRRDMEKMEREFLSLKVEFNTYLDNIFS